MSILNVIVLCIVSFIQNMAFTWSSRSRNSGDPKYHFFVANASNGVWFICQMFILKNIWKPLIEGDWQSLVFVGLFYVFFTSLGSSFMMKILLSKEKGKRKVGAS